MRDPIRPCLGPNGRVATRRTLTPDPNWPDDDRKSLGSLLITKLPVAGYRHRPACRPKLTFGLRPELGGNVPLIGRLTVHRG